MFILHHGAFSGLPNGWGAAAAHLWIWGTGIRAVCDALERPIVKNWFNPDCNPFRVKFFFAQDPKSVCHLRPNLVNEAVIQ